MTLKYLKKFLILSFVFNSANANALILLQQASVASGVEYDSNPTLSSAAKQGIWRYTLLPRYTVSVADSTNRWFSTVGVNLQKSSNKSVSANRKDPSLSLGWQHEYEKGRFDLIADYSKSSSRFNELTTTGLIDKDGSVISKSISAGLTRQLTERLDWSVNGRLLKSKYTGSDFTNTTTKSINSTLSYEYNEKIRPFFQLGISSLSADGGGSKSSISQNYLVGTNVELNPRLNVSAGAGLNHQGAVGTGWVANTSLAYIGERYNFTAGLSRNVSPSSLGQFQNTDNLNLAYQYSLSDKENLGTDCSWLQNNSAAGNDARQLGGWYTRELSAALKLRLSLNFKELKNSNQSAKSSILGLTLIYNTPEF